MPGLCANLFIYKNKLKSLYETRLLNQRGLGGLSESVFAFVPLLRLTDALMMASRMELRDRVLSRRALRVIELIP